jgi:hypothetical protein
VKTVYGWVVDWGAVQTSPHYTGLQRAPLRPRVTVDLFFSSREVFENLVHNGLKETLVPVVVDDSFDDLDFVPENY